MFVHSDLFRSLLLTIDQYVLGLLVNRLLFSIMVCWPFV